MVEMNALDSPLQSLALNYLSYRVITAAVNNICSWIAVFLEAVGFWASSLPEPRGCRRLHHAASTPPCSQAATTVEAAIEPAIKDSSSPKGLLSRNWCMMESECSPKGKFIMHYNDEDDLSESDDQGGEEGEDHGGGVMMVNEKSSSRRWNEMMVVRMGDMGWYRFQDLEVLDGSVVRLWDAAPGGWSEVERRRRMEGGRCRLII